MSRSTPEIVTGARGAKGSLDEQFTRVENEAQVAVRKKAGLGPGVFELHSRHSELYLQITSPSDRLDPQTGSITRARPLKVKFHHGRALVSDPEIVHRIRGCVGSNEDKAGCQLHRDGLAPHPNYGLGRGFWDAQEAVAAGQRKRVENAKETIRKDPEALKSLMQELGLEDFSAELLNALTDPKKKPAKVPEAA